MKSLSDTITALFQVCDPNYKKWHKYTRRLFLITLPISGPAYVCIRVVLILLLCMSLLALDFRYDFAKVRSPGYAWDFVLDYLRSLSQSIREWFRNTWNEAEL